MSEEELKSKNLLDTETNREIINVIDGPSLRQQVFGDLYELKKKS